MSTTLRELTLEITQDCMNRCVYCSSRAVPHSEMPAIEAETVSKVVADAMTLGLRSLAISGGEPFLHPDIRRILTECAGYRVRRLVVYTSGVFRDDGGGAVSLPDELTAMARSCKAELVFNVQSTLARIHDGLVGAKGRLAMTLLAMQRAVAGGNTVECHIVPNHQNARSLASTARHLISLGVRRVSFLRLVPQGYALENREMIVCNDEDDAIMREQFRLLLSDPNADHVYRFGVPFSKHSRTRKACGAGCSKAIMRWDGTFLPCEAFKECNDPPE